MGVENYNSDHNLFIDVLSKHFQMSTRNTFILASVSPIIFALLPFLQFWIFHLYHKYGHPWSHIIFPEQDQYAKAILRQETPKADAEFGFFADFWKRVAEE